MKQTNLILILLIIYAEASSQIVNVESSRMQSDTVGRNVALLLQQMRFDLKVCNRLIFLIRVENK